MKHLISHGFSTSTKAALTGKSLGCLTVSPRHFDTVQNNRSFQGDAQKRAENNMRVSQIATFTLLLLANDKGLSRDSERSRKRYDQDV